MNRPIVRQQFIETIFDPLGSDSIVEKCALEWESSGKQREERKFDFRGFFCGSVGSCGNGWFPRGNERWHKEEKKEMISLVTCVFGAKYRNHI